jgi:hypothetical protein
VAEEYKGGQRRLRLGENSHGEVEHDHGACVISVLSRERKKEMGGGWRSALAHVERKKGKVVFGARGDNGVVAALRWQARAVPACWNRGSRGSGTGEETREGEAADMWAT